MLLKREITRYRYTQQLRGGDEDTISKIISLIIYRKRGEPVIAKRYTSVLETGETILNIYPKYLNGFIFKKYYINGNTDILYELHNKSMHWWIKNYSNNKFVFRYYT